MGEIAVSLTPNLLVHLFLFRHMLPALALLGDKWPMFGETENAFP